MEVINPASKLFRQIIGQQTVDGDGRLRLSKYVVEERTKEGVLLYNVLTKKFVLLSGGELADKNTRQRLASDWFLVDEGFDDAKFCQQVRQVAEAMQRRKDGTDKYLRHYTVFTTMDCNARCYYCFEGKARRNAPMTRGVAEEVARYIMAHTGGRETWITWFGGEPLYNMSAIDTITNMLKDGGQPFHSDFYSNGFLFSRAVVEKARTEWNAKKVCITLDGTKRVYNRTKAYIYRGVNAFERVLENIRLLLDAGIEVDIRLNVSSGNGEDLLRLVDDLHLRFGRQEKLCVYARILYDGTDYGRRYTPSELNKVQGFHSEIERKVREYGYGSVGFIRKELPTNMCKGDNPHSVLVFPDGRLGKCEHYLDDKFVGSIYGGSLDEAVVGEFCQRIDLPKECESCQRYPDCILLELCEIHHICSPYERSERIAELHEQVRNTYCAWKEWKK